MTETAEYFEEMSEVAESGANFLGGMQFDPRLPDDVREAVKTKSAEMHSQIEKILEAS